MVTFNKALNIFTLFFFSATLVIWHENSSNRIVFTFLLINAALLTAAILITKHQSPFKWLAEEPIKFYWFAIFISLSIIIPLGVNNSIDYWNDVLVEAHGLIFDLIVFGILLTSYETIKNKLNKDASEKSEKESTISRYEEEIDDFRDWNTQEAKIRIRGNIRRANKLGHNCFQLQSINLSEVSLRKVNLTDSRVTDTIFSNCNMENCMITNVIGSSTKFNGANTFLLNANFTGSEFQHAQFKKAYLNGADFTNATLSNIDFRKADLRNTKWENAYLYEPNFLEAKVDKDFLNRLKKSNLKGHKVYDWYTIEEIEIPNYPGHFEYKLWPIPRNERDMTIYNFTVDDVRLE